MLALWVGGLGHLAQQVAPKDAVLSAGTALAFSISAMALYAMALPSLPARRRAAAKAAAFVVALTGAWILLQYTAEVPSAGYLFGPGFGRVSQATALNFILLGLAIMGFDSRLYGHTVSAFAAIGLVICSQALTTYAYDAQALYMLRLFSAMSPLTALVFAALFILTLLAQPFSGWMGYIVSQSSGGLMARRLLPAIVLIPFLLGGILVITESRNYLEPAFGYAIMATTTTTLLTVIACVVSASLADADARMLRVHESLRESEAAARAITDTALDAFIQINRDGCIVAWNRQAETLFGWPRGDIIGHRFERMLPPEFRAEYLQAMTRYLKTGATTFLGRRVERKMLARDGKAVAVEISSTALQREEGPVFNLFIRDLTQKNAVEQQLRHVQKMEAVGTLTGGMAHDFNNILGVIVGNLDILEDRLQDDESRAIVADVLAAALSGSELTRRLLAFARRQPLAPQPIAVNTMVENMGQLLKRTLGEHIKVSMVLGPDLWQTRADPAQLESAILNLCTNARDAMPNGGELTLRTENGYLDADYTERFGDLEPGDYVVVEVSDNGCGISKDVLDHIFEPFFTTKAQGKGTGLGLSMVFGFLKQSGGHVNVYSEAGLGTTFRLYLPRQTATDEAMTTTERAGLSSGGNEVILVVEDNFEMRQVVVRQMTSLGYEPLEAEDVAAAQKILERENVDLLFTDIIMPGPQNGLDLAWITRERWPQIAILLTSGFPADRVEAQSDRVSGFRLLSKPYRKVELAQALRTALDTQKAAISGGHDQGKSHGIDSAD